MKRDSGLSKLVRWVGPAAIVGGTFAMVSDQMGLVVHLPEVGADTMGYHAVGSGLFLLVLTLLFVGMLGLHAGRHDPRGAKVIEYGDAGARYVLVTDEGAVFPDLTAEPAAATPRLRPTTSRPSPRAARV